MARKIAEAAQAAQQPGEDQIEGAVFVKNQTNEIIRFDDGTVHKFNESRNLVTNPELIEKLRAVAAKDGNPYGLFEVDR